MVACPQVAFVCIGNEILSGKTRDSNLPVLSAWLTARGLRLCEARVIPDVERVIVETVNTLRKQYDYVFTSGGIGPTHDDITSAAIAKAFDVSLVLDQRALDALSNHYGDTKKLTPSRKKMACIPKGSSLVDNPVSGASGFSLENVYVLAGVPSIFRAMLHAMDDSIAGGDIWLSESVEVYCGESTVAEKLAAIQNTYQNTEIGSYPKYSEQHAYYTELVFSSQQHDDIQRARAELLAFTRSKNIADNYT